LPPEITAYLRAGLLPWPTEPWSGWREWAARLGVRRLAAQPDEGEIERVLEFLETL
jgi:hypothetical protein